MINLPDVVLEPLVRAALIEDLGRGGDATAALLSSAIHWRGEIRARKAGVASGLGPARLAFALINPAIVFTAVVEDGAALSPGQTLARVQGPARDILAAERVALNFLTLLSGTATLTRAFVEAVAGTGAMIAGTRKTLPGLRAVQKAAIAHGGGWPHRMGLDDAILVKDNHIAAAGSISAAVAVARAAAGHMRVVEVEIDRLAQLEEALSHRPNAVLLDNFSLPDLAAAVRQNAGRAILEASGGVSLASVRAIAETGVDVISAGALTHSAPALDLGLDAAE